VGELTVRGVQREEKMRGKRIGSDATRVEGGEGVPGYANTVVGDSQRRVPILLSPTPASSFSGW